MPIGQRLKRLFERQTPVVRDDVGGQFGWGAPLAIVYKRRNMPPVDNNGVMAYQTYLSPKWTPIGGGIPNKRDTGTSAPGIALQGVLVSQLGAPGIIAGAFASGPLTNISTDASEVPMIQGQFDYAIPGL